MKLPVRARRWLIIATAVVGLYAILGFLVAPPVARVQIEKRASAALKRPVTLKKVRMNPFTFSVTLEDLRVLDHDGGELATWQSAYANFDPATSLFRREWHLGDVRLIDPRQRLWIAPDGQLNIADLFAAPANPMPTEKKDASPAFGVGRLEISNWSLEFTDRSRPREFQTIAGPMSFSVQDFSTRAGTDSPYAFSGTTNSGEKFSWSGALSLDPLGSRGHFSLQDFLLPKHMPYAESLVAAELRSGRLSVEGDYAVTLQDGLAATLANTTVALDDVAVHTTGGAEAALAFRHLKISVAAADFAARTAAIARVQLAGLRVLANRRVDGSIDLADLLAPPAGTVAPASLPAGDAPDSGPAPSVRVAEIVLEDAAVTVHDATTPRPALMRLDQIQINATNAGTDLDQEIGLNAALRWNETGTMRAQGTIRLLPLAARLEISADALGLAPLENYLEPHARVQLAHGHLSFAGTVNAAQAPREKLQVAWTGAVSVDDLRLNDPADGSELLTWKSLGLTGLTFALDPLEIRAAEIALIDPRASVRISPEGQLNLTALRPGAGAPAEVVTAVPDQKTSERLAAATRKSLPFTASIDAITIAGGHFSVNDQSVTPAFATALHDFAGSIRGLSSAELARAEVDLRGSLDGVAPLHIAGKINPLAQDRFTEITLDFGNINLPLFTPYAGKFLGQTIREGKLRLDLNYKLSQSELSAENRLVLDQFFLGEKVESPDALRLPLGLALAVLRERDGTIPINLPIRGNLDDPDFKYWGVVMQFLGNLFVKAATAPFKMLGGLFGGGKELDLGSVDFASGAIAFTPEATEKLTALAKALYARPALRLAISAPPAPDGDRAGLRELRLQAQLRAVSADIIEPDAQVQALFAQRFPEEVAPAADAATETDVAPAAAVPEAKPTGWLRRMTRQLFGGGSPAPTPRPPAESPSAPVPEDSLPPPPTVPEMRARLLATIELKDADFRDLAAARAGAIREILLANGTIEATRITVAEQPTIPEDEDAATDGARVFFGLE